MKDVINRQTKRRISLFHDYGAFSEDSWKRIRDMSYKEQYGQVFLTHILIHNLFNVTQDKLSFFLDLSGDMCFKVKHQNNENNEKRDVEMSSIYTSYTTPLEAKAEICVLKLDKKEKISEALFNFEEYSYRKNSKGRYDVYGDIVIMSTCCPSELDLEVVKKFIAKDNGLDDYYISIIETDKEPMKTTQNQKNEEVNKLSCETNENKSEVHEEPIFEFCHSLVMGKQRLRELKDNTGVKKYVMRYEGD